MSKQKYKEKSKVLSIRVPESRISDYRARFNFMLQQDKTKEGLSFPEMSDKAFKEISKIFSKIKLILLKEGTLSIEKFNQIVKTTDLSYNKTLTKFFKKHYIK